MPERTLDPENLSKSEDWQGNNAAFTCPVCTNVFIVSAAFHTKGRACPACGKSKGFVAGGRKSGGSARIEWE